MISAKDKTQSPSPAASLPSSSVPVPAPRPMKQGKLKSFLRRNFFDEENIGLNSAKEISQNWHSSIDKITDFIEAKEHYIYYILTCATAIGGGLLYYKFKSLTLEKRYLLERQKNSLVTGFLLKEAFTKDVEISSKRIGLYKKGLFDIKECPDYKKVWADHFKKFKEPQDQPLVLVGRPGTGKTDLLASIFTELRQQHRMVAYTNLENCHSDSLSLCDILLHSEKSVSIALRTMMAQYTDQQPKPLLLIDNAHLLGMMPHRLQILKEIEHLRWSRACNFLIASDSSVHSFDPEGVLMSYKALDFEGATDQAFYKALVLRLSFDKETQKKVLALKPNLYLLQQLVLASDRDKVLKKFSK